MILKGKGAEWPPENLSEWLEGLNHLARYQMSLHIKILDQKKLLSNLEKRAVEVKASKNECTDSGAKQFWDGYARALVDLIHMIKKSEEVS